MERKERNEKTTRVSFLHFLHRLYSDFSNENKTIARNKEDESIVRLCLYGSRFFPLDRIQIEQREA